MTSAAPRLSLLVYKVPREGMPPFRFNFSELGLPFNVARGFRRALEADTGHTSLENQIRSFLALKKLSQCLEDLCIKGKSPLPADTLQRFANWLDALPIGSAAQSTLTRVQQLALWCERNAPKVFAKHADLTVRKIRKVKLLSAKEGLPEKTIREILRACYEDIERIEKERAQIRRILSGKCESEKEKDFFLLICDLMRVGRRRLPTRSLYHTARLALERRVNDFGGSRVVAPLLYLSPRDVLPFLVAILAQSSGNPESIGRAEAECISRHPIREDLERVVWLKGRGGKEHFADFPKGKRWTAPDLVRRLNALTAELRPRAVRHDRRKLFICYRWHNRSIGKPGAMGMLKELRAFIARHSLPPFQFKDLRRAGAQVVQSVRGKVEDAQKHLHHSSASTTQRYTRTQAVADKEDQIVHAHQVQFVQLAKTGTRMGELPETAPSEFSIPTGGMETVFGFRCKDPYSGIAQGSVRGSVCLQFFSCASCPGAFIPLDDVNVVARLLAAMEVLSEARSRAQVEGWWKRYEAMYEPTRRLIADTFLPAVSQPILDRARPLTSTRIIPRLE